jgi:signal peptidase I
MPVIKGDRIFVLKCLYQFMEPKRWDVVVFKNPLDPHENYIKRLIALPGEKVEIIDGDIYINDRIARKPTGVQNEPWMCIYDNDYQPVNPSAGNFNRGVWRQPFVNFRDSRWNLNAAGPTVFSLDESTDEVHEVVYDTSTGNDFRAAYAYDDPRGHEFMPICSDLLVSFDVDQIGDGSRVGASVTKYGVEYKAWVDSSGRMSVEKVHANGLVEELVTGDFAAGAGRVCGTFRFANVDHRLALEFAGKKIEYDMGSQPDSMGAASQQMPRVAILGTGVVRLMHIGLYRDIHYIGIRADGGDEILRASEGDPFTLGDDEFFVLGDNSPASLDCRWWDSPGLANNGGSYREGTVPRDYLVGKAFFVYWPGPFKPFNDSGIARMLEGNRAGKILKMLLNVPYVDGMKIIRGGK